MSPLEILVLCAKLMARYELRNEDYLANPNDPEKRQLMQWAYDDWNGALIFVE